MDPVPITDKGILWLVHPDGSIWSSPAISGVTRAWHGGELHTYTRHDKSKQLANTLSKSGYYYVACQRNGRRVKVFAHRLIARAFVSGYEPHLSVNHINGNKLDNRPDNLEWLTLPENSKHQWETGLINHRGEDHPCHKLTQKQVIHIRKALRLGVSANSLSIIAGVSSGTIYQIEWGKRWKHLTDEPTSSQTPDCRTKTR